MVSQSALMLFNSRSVAFLQAVVVSILAGLALGFSDSVSTTALLITLAVTFMSVYLLSFVLLEILIFRELRKVYGVFEHFQGKKIQRDRNINMPAKKISQELYTFANRKEREIEKLKRMEEFRREFLANVSHELKTPIFSAQGFIHTLLDGAMDDERVRDKFLQKSARSLDHLDNLVQDLLSISQMETGETKMKIAKVNLKHLVQDAFDQCGAIAKERKATVEVIAPKEELIVHADEFRIGQVVKNLVENGIKYGGSSPIIKVHLQKKDKEVEICVQDNGPGIPEEHQDRIFERFYRVEKSRSREMGGTGLGLAIVKHIIEAHKSNILLESSPQKGTKFTFTLKAVDRNILNEA